MKKIYLTGALLASALAIAGCDRGGGNVAANASNAAAPAPAAPAGTGDAAENGSGAEGGATAGARQDFTITNNTGHTVVTLNVSSSNEDEWGPDILGRDVLANGESAQVTFQRGQDQCEWDVRATYDDGDTTDARGVNLCQVATVTLTAAE